MASCEYKCAAGVRVPCDAAKYKGQCTLTRPNQLTCKSESCAQLIAQDFCWPIGGIISYGDTFQLKNGGFFLSMSDCSKYTRTMQPPAYPAFTIRPVSTCADTGKPLHFLTDAFLLVPNFKPGVTMRCAFTPAQLYTHTPEKWYGYSDETEPPAWTTLLQRMCKPCAPQGVQHEPRCDCTSCGSSRLTFFDAPTNIAPLQMRFLNASDPNDTSAVTYGSKVGLQMATTCNGQPCSRDSSIFWFGRVMVNRRTCEADMPEDPSVAPFFYVNLWNNLTVPKNPDTSEFTILPPTGRLDPASSPCAYVETACRTTNDCPAGKVCAEGKCITQTAARCTSSADCGPGEICTTQRTCVPAPPVPQPKFPVWVVLVIGVAIAGAIGVGLFVRARTRKPSLTSKIK